MDLKPEALYPKSKTIVPMLQEVRSLKGGGGGGPPPQMNAGWGGQGSGCRGSGVEGLGVIGFLGLRVRGS